jgi:short-subunit dehydrogenase
MQRRGSGAILNIGSASAFQPLPHYGIYAATKAYVISFSAALWAEARRYGVQVVAVCPGPVDADAPEGPDSKPPRRRLRRKVTREQVVASAFEALERDLPLVLPGAPPRVARFALGLLPRRTRLRFTGLLLRRFPSMLTGTRRRDP